MERYNNLSIIIIIANEMSHNNVVRGCANIFGVKEEVDLLSYPDHLFIFV